MKTIKIILFFSVVAGVIFLIFPSLDLGFSAFFYRNGSFFLKHNLLLRIVFRAVPVVTIIYSLFILFGYGFLKVTRRDKFCLFDKKSFLYLILALAIGPGLLVNVGLKDHFGRARPSQIVQFGGDKTFTPACVPSDQVEPNGSFVCGHAAVGFSLVSIALLFEGRRRRRLMAAAVLSGGLIGLVRIAQGGHFLSDVIFSFVFVYLVSFLLHAYMFRQAWLPDDTQERLSHEVA